LAAVGVGEQAAGHQLGDRLEAVLLGPGRQLWEMADAGSVLRWQYLDHVGDQPVQWIAAPPDGRASGVLFAHAADAHGQHASTRRSRDGGTTWETVPDPPGPLVVAPGGSPAFSLADDGLHRSTDAGVTWTAVAPVHGGLVFSPTFPQDGTVFLLADDALYRSTDAGATWSPESVQGSSLLLSPAFAQDGTAFLLGGGSLWRSTDGGLTWSDLDPGQGQTIALARLSARQGNRAWLTSEPLPAYPKARISRVSWAKLVQPACQRSWR
jgi:photosystem II stability/assembly factor-like uncharacterized protein